MPGKTQDPFINMTNYGKTVLSGDKKGQIEGFLKTMKTHIDKNENKDKIITWLNGLCQSNATIRENVRKYGNELVSYLPSLDKHAVKKDLETAEIQYDNPRRSNNSSIVESVATPEEKEKAKLREKTLSLYNKRDKRSSTLESASEKIMRQLHQVHATVQELNHQQLSDKDLKEEKAAKTIQRTFRLHEARQVESPEPVAAAPIISGSKESEIRPIEPVTTISQQSQQLPIKGDIMPKGKKTSDQKGVPFNEIAHAMALAAQAKSRKSVGTRVVEAFSGAVGAVGKKLKRSPKVEVAVPVATTHDLGDDTLSTVNPLTRVASAAVAAGSPKRGMFATDTLPEIATKVGKEAAAARKAQSALEAAQQTIINFASGEGKISLGKFKDACKRFKPNEVVDKVLASLNANRCIAIYDALPTKQLQSKFIGRLSISSEISHFSADDLRIVIKGIAEISDPKKFKEIMVLSSGDFKAGISIQLAHQAVPSASKDRKLYEAKLQHCIGFVSSEKTWIILNKELSDKLAEVRGTYIMDVMPKAEAKGKKITVKKQGKEFGRMLGSMVNNEFINSEQGKKVLDDIFMTAVFSGEKAKDFRFVLDSAYTKGLEGGEYIVRKLLTLTDKEIINLGMGRYNELLEKAALSAAQHGDTLRFDEVAAKLTEGKLSSKATLAKLKGENLFHAACRSGNAEFIVHVAQTMIEKSGTGWAVLMDKKAMDLIAYGHSGENVRTSKRVSSQVKKIGARAAEFARGHLPLERRLTSAYLLGENSPEVKHLLEGDKRHLAHNARMGVFFTKDDVAVIMSYLKGCYDKELQTMRHESLDNVQEQAASKIASIGSDIAFSKVLNEIYNNGQPIGEVVVDITSMATKIVEACIENADKKERGNIDMEHRLQAALKIVGKDITLTKKIELAIENSKERRAIAELESYAKKDGGYAFDANLFGRSASGAMKGIYKMMHGSRAGMTPLKGTLKLLEENFNVEAQKSLLDIMEKTNGQDMISLFNAAPQGSKVRDWMMARLIENESKVPGLVKAAMEHTTMKVRTPNIDFCAELVQNVLEKSSPHETLFLDVAEQLTSVGSDKFLKDVLMKVGMNTALGNKFKDLMHILSAGTYKAYKEREILGTALESRFKIFEQVSASTGFKGGENLASRVRNRLKTSRAMAAMDVDKAYLHKSTKSLRDRVQDGDISKSLKHSMKNGLAYVGSLFDHIARSLHTVWDYKAAEKIGVSNYATRQVEKILKHSNSKLLMNNLLKVCEDSCKDGKDLLYFLDSVAKAGDKDHIINSKYDKASSIVSSKLRQDLIGYMVGLSVNSPIKDTDKLTALFFDASHRGDIVVMRSISDLPQMIDFQNGKALTSHGTTMLHAVAQTISKLAERGEDTKGAVDLFNKIANSMIQAGVNPFELERAANPSAMRWAVQSHGKAALAYQGAAAVGKGVRAIVEELPLVRRLNGLVDKVGNKLPESVKRKAGLLSSETAGIDVVQNPLMSNVYNDLGKAGRAAVAESLKGKDTDLAAAFDLAREHQSRRDAHVTYKDGSYKFLKESSPQQVFVDSQIVDLNTQDKTFRMLFEAVMAMDNERNLRSSYNSTDARKSFEGEAMGRMAAIMPLLQSLVTHACNGSYNDGSSRRSGDLKALTEELAKRGVNEPGNIASSFVEVLSDLASDNEKLSKTFIALQSFADGSRDLTADILNGKNDDELKGRKTPSEVKQALGLQQFIVGTVRKELGGSGITSLGTPMSTHLASPSLGEKGIKRSGSFGEKSAKGALVSEERASSLHPLIPVLGKKVKKKQAIRVSSFVRRRLGKSTTKH